MLISKFKMGFFIMVVEATRTANTTATINAYSTGAAKTQATPAAEGAKKATTPPAAASTAENPKAYQEAYDKISEIVKNGADAKEVNEAIYAISGPKDSSCPNPGGFKGLSQSDKRKLIDQLVSENKLDKFMHEMVDSATFGGGISRENRIDFFNDMAANLNGKQLAAMQQSLVKADKAFVNARSNQEFSDSIASHCKNEQIKVEFIKELAPLAADQKKYKSENDGYIRSLKDNLYDPEARAISTVLSSFKTGDSYNFVEAYNAIQNVKVNGVSVALSSVINASLKPVLNETQPVEYNTHQFEKISKLLSQSNNLEDKVAFSIEAGSVLGNIGDWSASAKAKITEATLKVILSDTARIIDRMRSADGNGKAAFPNLVKSMVQDVEGGEKTLNELVKSFMTSAPKDGSLNTVKLFDSKSTDPKQIEAMKIRAQSLGYIVGSVSKAFDNINAEIAKKKEIAVAIFNDILGPLASVTGTSVSNTFSLILGDALFKDAKSLANGILDQIIKKPSVENESTTTDRFQADVSTNAAAGIVLIKLD